MATLSQQPQRSIRPAFAVLLALAVGAILAAVWVLSRRAAPPPPAADETPEATQASAPEPEVVPPVEVVTTDPPPLPTQVYPPSTLEQQGGIQVVGLKLVMGGVGVEVHYQITSIEKSALLASSNAPAVLVDRATGTRVEMGTPIKPSATSRHSQARSARMMMGKTSGFPPTMARLRPGATYSLLMPNPNGLIRSGSKVSVVVGDICVNNLTVP